MRFIDLLLKSKTKELARLRENFDSRDTFLDRGHAVRGGGRSAHTERVADTPDWVNDNEEVRALLLRVFPKLESDALQRERAGVWMTVIHMFFRLGYTRLHVAMLMDWPFTRVHSTIRNIRRAKAGKEVGGGGRPVNRERGIRPRGRPRKLNSALATAPFGSTGDDGN